MGIALCMEKAHSWGMLKKDNSKQIESISLEEKVAFLKRPASYPHRPQKVEVTETHMSWVFLADDLVYKLKKPVRYDYLDFSTADARRADCEKEVQLNRRLAKDIYIGVESLKKQKESGALTLNGEGVEIDSLVKMHRLPAEKMLDVAIRNDSVKMEDLSRVSILLTHFYLKKAAQIDFGPRAYLQRFERDVDSNHQELMKPEYGLSHSLVEQLTKIQKNYLRNQGHVLVSRARDGQIVEAHGDLRPEHICLLSDPVVIDCLEFNREFRLLDPLDELAYLALECERLGAPSVGEKILSDHLTSIGERRPGPLIDFYKVFRACLRAKIALWHTDDHKVIDHDKWRERAREYLELAEHYIFSISSTSESPVWIR